MALFISVLLRLIEMYAISAVPSLISLWIALHKLTSSANGIVAWRCICMGAFLISLAFHIWFWNKDVISLENDGRAFYTINGTAFAIYAAMVAVFDKAEIEVFSAIYGALRGFELFGLPTVLSSIISLAVMLVCMIATKRVVGKRVEWFKAIAAEENMDDGE